MDPRVEPEGDDWWRMWIRDCHTHNVIPCENGNPVHRVGGAKGNSCGQDCPLLDPRLRGDDVGGGERVVPCLWSPPGTYFILSLSKDGRHARCPKPRPSTGSG